MVLLLLNGCLDADISNGDTRAYSSHFGYSENVLIKVSLRLCCRSICYSKR